jgi:hypothetical protein
MSSILALIPRCCTEKISLPARWMICAQNNASEIYFEANGERRGGFFFCCSLFLAAWDSAVAGPAFPCPSEPPIFAARHFSSLQDLHPSVPAKDLFPSKRNAHQSTVEPQTERGNRARDVNGENTAHPRICFSGVKVSSREEKLEKLETLETARGNTGGGTIQE